MTEITIQDSVFGTRSGSGFFSVRYQEQKSYLKNWKYA